MSALTGDRWRALSPHLDQALDLTPEQRRPWLADLGRHDPELAADLQALLDEREALDKAGFLEEPIAIARSTAGETPKLPGSDGEC
jgi:hypothetical protein